MKTFILRTLLGLGVVLGGCAVPRPPVRIHGDFEVAANDDQLLFAAISAGCSGLYTLRTTSPAVVSAVLVRSNSGIFSSPCYLARHRRLVYLYHQRGGSTIESCTLAGDSVQTLFATSFPLTSLAVAPTEDRLYFVAARNVGHSSPVAPISARDVRLYTITLGDSTARPASHLQAYQSQGKPQFDASGQHLLLNLFSPKEVGLSGPFALNLTHDGLRYLLPTSLLRHKTRLREPATGTTARFNRIFQDFVRPVPAYLDSSYYLIDHHQVIKVSAGAAPPQMLYRNWLTSSKSDDRAEAYSIAGATPLHHSDSLLVYEEGLKTLRFLLFGPDGHRRQLPVPLPLPRPAH